MEPQHAFKFKWEKKENVDTYSFATVIELVFHARGCGSSGSEETVGDHAFEIECATDCNGISTLIFDCVSMLGQQSFKLL